MSYVPVPNPTLQRLPAYLQFLKRLQKEGSRTVSCNYIAAEMNLNPVLVRKDLAAVSSVGGRPKIGYLLDNLIVDVEHYLGYAETCKAVLAGAGHLGCALLAYPGFPAYGVEIVAAFDQDPTLVGTKIGDKPVLSSIELAGWCRAHDIELGMEKSADEMGVKTIDDIRIIEGKNHPLVKVATRLLTNKDAGSE